jgi:hypothetical protein
MVDYLVSGALRARKGFYTSVKTFSGYDHGRTCVIWKMLCFPIILAPS